MRHRCGFEAPIRANQIDPPECAVCDRLYVQAEAAWEKEGEQYLRETYEEDEIMEALVTLHRQNTVAGHDKALVRIYWNEQEKWINEKVVELDQ